MSKDTAIYDVVKESYADTGAERSIEVTLSGTPGTLTTITLPADVKGFRLYSRTSTARFAVYHFNNARTLAAVATDSTGTVAASAFAIGGVVKPDAWETRLLPSVQKYANGTAIARILTLRSITASVVIDVEVF